MSRVKTSAMTSLAALVLIFAGLFTTGTATASPKGATWGEKYFPNLPVVTQDGKKLNFYDDLIKDKKVVVSFIYTNCPDICGLTTARLAEVQKRLGKLVGTEVNFYSISLDPQNDTPKALKAYAKAFHAGSGWLFLTGKPNDLALIRYKLGERSRYLAEHRNFIILGNDQTGEWSRTSIMTNLDLVASQIRELDPQFLNGHQQRAVNLRSNKAYRLSSTPGEALFFKACATCHTFGMGDHVGPDLAGVTERRDHDWLVRFMMDPEVLVAQKDPLAVALDNKFKGVKMPDLSLSKDDAADLIAYFKYRTKAITERAASNGHHVHPDGTVHDHNHATHTHGAAGDHTSKGG